MLFSEEMADILLSVTWIAEQGSSTFQSEEKLRSGELMQYGAPYGDPQFLTALADFLSAEYGEPVDQ